MILRLNDELLVHLSGLGSPWVVHSFMNLVMFFLYSTSVHGNLYILLRNTIEVEDFSLIAAEAVSCMCANDLTVLCTLYFMVYCMF